MKFKIYILLSVLLMVSFSCTNDENNNRHSSGPVEVAFSVTLPEPEDVQTRAYTDRDIKNITVLLFDENNKFMERIDVDGSDITSEANGIKFNIVVDATPNNRTLHLIANARTVDGTTDRVSGIAGLTTTQTEAQIIPAITTKSIMATGDDALINNITPLIMWGRVTLNGVSIMTTVDNVKLLRSVACVRVKKGTEIYGNGLDKLVISQMAIHNGAGQGNVTPANYTSPVATNPTTANPFTFTAFDYTKAWSSGAEPVAYIYERNCTNDNYMSVILQGSYSNKAGYYKIVLANGDTPIDIIRNHRYTITITAVNGPGYSDVATAVSMPPSNAIKAEIMDDHEEYPVIVADSKHWMGMSNGIFHLIGSTYGNTITPNVEFCTVYSSRGIAPVITNTSPWITAINVVSVGSNEYKVVGSVETSASLSGALVINCDNLSFRLPVQRTCPISVFDNEFAEDADSYVFNFVGSLQGWRAWVPNPDINNKVHLHPTDGSPSALTANSGAGMVTELTAAYHGNAYLHIAKESNRRDEVWTTAYSSNVIVVRKTVIAQ